LSFAATVRLGTDGAILDLPSRENLFGLDRRPRQLYRASNIKRLGRTPANVKAAPGKPDALQETTRRNQAYEETTVSDFVLAYAVAAAERVIDSRGKITISARNCEAFYYALVNPPGSNEKPREAARRYRERVGG
jgi:uncharacterized protein (DUF1778 family)